MKQPENSKHDIGEKLQNIGDRLQGVGEGMSKGGNKAMGAGCAIFIIILVILYFVGCFR
ncbi:hypothetical protein [Chitinophaga sp. sic0106]|uniref:hypothetical protein n=1 Tax=Chitinophaga sp. sic0106 TaxID=2854785 RepID=UPI001C446BE8|nr:hypothetical protein [Chitinophaga sp. sic0106]MBV7529017.1 hypothetical protein [Chitinophaga sp. sic0106]